MPDLVTASQGAGDDTLHFVFLSVDERDLGTLHIRRIPDGTFAPAK